MPFLDLYTIEFQNRGLPHCHILLWLSDSDKIRNPTTVDNFISAELPNLCSKPLLYQIVTTSLIHGPCGLLNMKFPCMKDGRCTKRYPKPFVQSTTFNKHDYAHYKRNLSSRHTIRSGVQIDNGFIVPYNKILGFHFNAHINVECCGWNMMIKYLFKYIF